MDFAKKIKKYESQFNEDLKGLVKIASIRDDYSKSEKAPFGAKCQEALTYMQTLCEKYGFETSNIDGYALLVTYGEGEESYGMLGHLDVVPADDGWTFDPFAAEIVEGFIVGRGVWDDKGPSMAALYAMRLIKDEGIVLKKKIMLILGMDEESGMECMEYYVKHALVPSCGFVPDADFPVIYGEKGMCQLKVKGAINTNISKMHAGTRSNIVIANAKAKINSIENIDVSFESYLNTNKLVGCISIDNEQKAIEIQGEAAHAATPNEGNNAALRVMEFVKNIYANDDVGKIYDLLKDWDGRGVKVNINSKTMGELTMNLGIIKIENNTFELVLDFRFPQESSTQLIIEKCQKAFLEMGFDVDISIEHSALPLYVDPDSKMVQTLTKAYQLYSNDYESKNQVIGGGTYAKMFPNFVAFGPEFPNPKKPKTFSLGKIHQNNEAANLEELYMACAIYAQVLYDEVI